MRKYAVALAVLLVTSACGGSSDSAELRAVPTTTTTLAPTISVDENTHYRDVAIQLRLPKGCNELSVEELHHLTNGWFDIFDRVDVLRGVATYETHSEASFAPEHCLFVYWGSNLLKMDKVTICHSESAFFRQLDHCRREYLEETFQIDRYGRVFLWAGQWNRM